MGLSNSTLTPIAACLGEVCGHRDDCFTRPSPFFDRRWVKPYNLAVLKKPIAIVRPNDALEVAGAIQCANRIDYKVQARSGGHSYGNHGLGGIRKGGLMVDLMHLTDFAMDTNTWHATVGAGTRLGELDQKLHKNGGRAIPHGTSPMIGIGGHATLGGLGPMSRMWGSTLDHVVEVEVVTADAKIQRASAEVNADLFWAVRGAGPSFGIVTEFVVKTRPEPVNVIDYTFSFGFREQGDIASVFEQWQDLVYDPHLDRRFSTMFIAEPSGALISTTFYGTEEEFNKTGILDRIPSGGTVNVTESDWLGGLAHMSETTGIYHSDTPTHFASKSLAFRPEDKIPYPAIKELFEFIGKKKAPTLLWFLIFHSHGGAMGDVPNEADAYPHRDKVMMYQSHAVGFPTVNRRVRKFVAAIHKQIRKAAPYANTTYAGYIDVSLKKTAQRTYWGEKLPQLEMLKRQWDPNDRFRNPQSVHLPFEKETLHCDFFLVCG